MDAKQYLKDSARTNNGDYVKIAERMLGSTDNNIDTVHVPKVDLLHAMIGMQTEAAEFADMLKKNLFYGKTLDVVNLREELGDQLWYIALALRALDTTFEEVMERNIAKLKARYPEKFTEELAENRDLETERKILEG